MKLSAKMPATMDSTLPAKMPATMPSDTQQTGDGSSDDAPQMACSQTTPKTVKWESINDNKPGWDIGSDEQKLTTWELMDRKDENDEGAMPQRDPDNDGDLN
jgi:hypothetical protein